MTPLRTLLVLAVAAGTGGIAHADDYGYGAGPGAAPPPPPMAEPAPPPPPPQLTHRISVGAQLAGLDLTADGDDESTGFEGGALHVRYRLHDRWSLELDLAAFSADMGELDRDLSMVTFAALLHLTPYSNWNWYVLAGVGGGKDELRFADSDIVEDEVDLGLFALGGGVERRFNQFGIGAELRLIGLSADDDTPPVVAGERNGLLLPAESSGGQFSVHASYYF